MSRGASIAVIAAYTKIGRVLGKDGRIPWSIPGERERFRLLTRGNAVVMGRRTYMEIGRPLPERLNIVLSRTERFSECGCKAARSLAEAQSLAAEAGLCNLFVCGGARLYSEAIPLSEMLYLTEIGREYDGDVFFPAVDESLFEKISEERHDGGIPYAYLTYRRARPFQAAWNLQDE